MILARLKEYADTRMQLPPAMYSPLPVRWLVNLTAEGELEGAAPFTPLGGDGKANKRGETRLVPDLVRASGIRPKLLADNGEYALGIARANSDAGKVAERHRRFKELVAHCAKATGEPSVIAVTRFLGQWRPDPSKLPAEFGPADTLTFRVEGVIPAVELSSVQAFWASYTAGESEDEASGKVRDKAVMQCLVTGTEGPVEARMPGKVKGLPGGQKSGTSLVSANAAAFTSYGLENSLTSPISRDAAERFGKALNSLIAGPDTRLYVGPVVYVFWTRAATAFNPRRLLSTPSAGEVKHLLTGVYRGGQVHGGRANCFYALALSASGGRTVVRNWLETTVPDAAANLERWFNAQAVVDEYGEEREPLGVSRLAEGLYRRSLKDRKFDAAKEIPARVTSELVEVALGGGSLPEELLAQAIRRCAVGTVTAKDAREHVTRSQAALIKLALCTRPGWEARMEELERLSPTPSLEQADLLAYQCGRLLATLEAVQRSALGGVNATIVEKFYGAAASTPATAFAPLLTNARAHLGKLRKERRGTWNALEEELENILEPFKQSDGTPRFPATLGTVQQGIFALGFYHQRAHNRSEAKRNAPGAKGSNPNAKNGQGGAA